MDIVKVIQETATWIEKVNKDYDFNLYRTPELIPGQHYSDVPGKEKVNMVNAIINKRSALLADAKVDLIPVSELYRYGRIMLFNPGQAICDGAAEEASAYYIDYTDSPPFDTWIAMGEQLTEIGFYNPENNLNDIILIGWVPQSQYFYADEAIQVSALELYKWAENQNISDRFWVLKDIFSKPGEFVKPTGSINFLRRGKMLYDITIGIDKKTIQNLLKEDKPKGSFQKLLGL